MAKFVNTVLGPISPRDMGITLVHEHLAWGHHEWKYDFDARERFIGRCVEVIRRAREYGLNTIIDATPIDGERDPELYREVAERAGINIICSTGLYFEGDRYPEKSGIALSGDRQRAVNEYCEYFISDINKGIEDSGVRPGVIKVATSRGIITPFEEMVLEAAAMAHRETGVPVITHTEDGTMGPRQAELLTGLGVDPGRLAIGHMCGNTDLQYQRQVLDSGAFVAFDRFGVEVLLPDADRASTLISLIKSGFEKQVLLSHDCVMSLVCGDSFAENFIPPPLANWNLSNIFSNILPALRESGIGEDLIRSIMTDNPRRLFGGE